MALKLMIYRPVGGYPINLSAVSLVKGFDECAAGECGDAGV